ncbi:MAG TPA: chemotaxis protein CheX [Humisphaera sp.]
MRIARDIDEDALRDAPAAEAADPTAAAVDAPTVRQVADIVAMVCERALGIYPRAAPAPDAAPAAAATGGPDMAARVSVTGAWAGTITVRWSADLATIAAAVVFDLPRPAVTDRDRADVLGELANMVGGHVKSLMPGPSCLSVPTILDGGDAAPAAGRVALESAFDCGGHRLVVTVTRPGAAAQAVLAA